MIGFSSFSEYAISDFPFIAFVPPTPPTTSGTDGYTRAQAKRYKQLTERLLSATRARDRARKMANEKIREDIERVIDPDKFKEPEIAVEKEEKKPTLKAKPLPTLEDEVRALEMQRHQMALQVWQQQEHARLIALEKRRAQERDDEEALLAIL